MRCSITGTTTSADARCSAVAASVCSGSKRRRSTSVEPNRIPSTKCAKPQAWNSGAAIIVTSPSCSGIFESSAAAGSTEVGDWRVAPFGVPVVPEVRITVRPGSPGGTGSDGSPRRIRCSSESSISIASSSPSTSSQATYVLRPSAASATRSVNSWS